MWSIGCLIAEFCARQPLFSAARGRDFADAMAKTSTRQRERGGADDRVRGHVAGFLAFLQEV
eukprot:4176494-Pyramimonas_sp.AAC.1